MKLFQQKTQVLSFSNCSEFLKEFPITSNDLVFASKTIYNQYLASESLPCEVMFHSDYGKGEPTDIMVDKLLNDVKGKSFDRIFAIGGGSVIDIAKLLVLKDATCALDLFEKKIPLIKCKEFFAIPTTCGSGSEVSNISIAEITSKGTKLGLAVDPLYPDYAILIPCLLKNLPLPIFAASAIDALVHAAESFVSPRSNPYTENFSISAIQMILNGFIQMVEYGPEERNNHLDDFMMASNYAGIAFGNTGTGCVHAMSYPLSGVYHVTHGEANYQMFLEVFKTYAKQKPEGKIQQFMKICADVMKCEINDVFNKMEIVLDQLLPHQPLHNYGMKEDEIITFTDSVIASQQRLLTNAYTPLDRDTLIQIYKTLY